MKYIVQIRFWPWPNDTEQRSLGPGSVDRFEFEADNPGWRDELREVAADRIVASLPAATKPHRYIDEEASHKRYREAEGAADAAVDVLRKRGLNTLATLVEEALAQGNR